MTEFANRFLLFASILLILGWAGLSFGLISGLTYPGSPGMLWWLAVPMVVGTVALLARK